MPTLGNAQARWIGTWQNERGSVLRIQNIAQQVISGGSGTQHFRVSGTYQTAAGRIPFTERCPVSGYVVLDQIGFTASFRYFVSDEDEVNSLTSWAGQVLPVPSNPGQQHLQTLWHLVPNFAEGENERQYGWVIAWAGEDRFRKLSNDPEFEIPQVDGHVRIVAESIEVSTYAASLVDEE